MFEAPDAVTIRMFAEWAKHALPVCTLFSGVAFALAFVEGRKIGGVREDARERLTGLLTSTSVWMMCGVVASALLLTSFALLEAAAGYATGRETSDSVKRAAMDAFLEEKRWQFTGLWLLSLLGVVRGVGMVLRAIGVSGYMRSAAEGKRTRRLEILGWGVIVLCVVLFLSPYGVPGNAG